MNIRFDIFIHFKIFLPTEMAPDYSGVCCPDICYFIFLYEPSIYPADLSNQSENLHFFNQPQMFSEITLFRWPPPRADTTTSATRMSKQSRTGLPISTRSRFKRETFSNFFGASQSGGHTSRSDAPKKNVALLGK